MADVLSVLRGVGIISRRRVGSAFGTQFIRGTQLLGSDRRGPAWDGLLRNRCR
jgi:hypothetical protein